jgi:pimeloyl-ACP methyl ester carboxylesterase
VNPEKWLRKRLAKWRKSRVPAIMVERGQDPSTVILAFSGHAQKLSLPAFEFFQVADLLQYSRILCRDVHRVWYHMGLGRKTPDYPSSIARIRELLSELGGNTTIAVGTSAGGYAALIFGHFLRVDSVHAFSPNTCLESRHAYHVRGLKSPKKADDYQRLEAYRRSARELFDIAKVLEHHNGKTRYFVHYCSGSERDRIDAERVGGLPGVTVFAHPCSGHAVARHLARRRLLVDLLKPENQEKLDDLLAAPRREP